jgi:hypothetical protein
MRESYDCVVAGHGPAASLVAGFIAASGFSVLLSSDFEAPGGEVLVPGDRASLAALARIGISGATLAAEAKRQIDVAYEPADVVKPHWLICGDQFSKLCLAGVVGEGHLDKVMGRPEVAARLAIDPCARKNGHHASAAGDVMISGRYRRVHSSPHATTGLVLRTDRGSCFWLVPLSEELTSLGLVLGGVDRGQAKNSATLWEEELVHAPEIAERLMDAELSSMVADWRGRHSAELLQFHEVRLPIPSGVGWPCITCAAELAERAVQQLAIPMESRL